MIQNVLQKELREKAGSDSYNRFEYQVHWIVYHMLSEYKRDDKKNYLIICEFHDDMAKLNCANNPDCVEFFQVKTTKRFKEWTLPRLTDEKIKQGTIKHSFLGFLFMNFLNFETECEKCHFVSNIGVNQEIRQWQSVIEDGKILLEEDPDLHTNIYNEIRAEYPNLDEDEFNRVFKSFIQNTFVYDGELPLNGYERALKGEFYDILSTEDVTTSTSYRILNDLIDDVRKKSKTIIDTPISFSRLKEKKGVSSSIIEQIKNSIDDNRNQTTYDDVASYLTSNGENLLRINLIIDNMKKHHSKMIDVSNVIYIDNVSIVNAAIDNVLIKHHRALSDIEMITNEIIKELKTTKSYTANFNEFEVEVLLYAKMFSA